MIAKIGRGQKLGGLLVYLLGSGEHNEHEQRHVVAGSPTLMRDAWLITFDGDKDKRASRDTALALAREMDLPRKLHGTKVRMRARPQTAARGRRVDVVERPEAGDKGVLRDAPVWHCVLALNPGEELSDEKWRQVIEDFMGEMGFTATADRAGARWVAVRHGHSGEHGDGNDHVHIAASLVRDDGQKVNTFDYGEGHARGDWNRAHEACNTLEHRHGLVVLESRETGGGMSGNSRAETERAKREGRPETERETMRRLVRSYAAASKTEAEFVRRALRDGKLSLFPFYEQGGMSSVRGYSAQLREGDGHRGPRLGGAKIASDLSIDELRKQWDDGPETREDALAEWKRARGLSASDREARSIEDPALWKRIAAEVRDWNKILKTIPPENHVEWAQAAGRASAVFASWSRRVEGDRPGPYAAAAAALARSAQPVRPARGARPRAVRTQTGLRGVVTFLEQMTRVNGDPAAGSLLLLQQMMRAIEAIAAAHAARAEAERARALTTVLRQRLIDVHHRYAVSSGTYRGPAVGSAESRELLARQREGREPWARIAEARLYLDPGLAPTTPKPAPRPTYRPPDTPAYRPPSGPERGPDRGRGR
ncbi:relaxase/mobilization nuclease domain-containing protein (plasmid) [Nocardia sp. CA-135953]|uniref:relaxase/mobilization nuclease domain-containing protein n=1 Tax=Nocardia sp. CA-135953 TaxID=3239978 RepID=UPI003D99A502